MRLFSKTSKQAEALTTDETQVPQFETRPIFFGGIKLVESEAATYHFMLVGATGSGKTLNIRMMMGSVLPGIIERPDCRAVVFDVKQDAVSVLSGILERTARENGKTEEEVSKRLIITNPFDSRCHEWDMARDITSPEIALQVATILIPEEESQNRFFSDAARDLLTGVLNVFIEKKPADTAEGWGLSDLVYTMRSEERIRHILSQTEEGQDLIELYLNIDKTSISILATIRAKLAPFEVPAALWRLAKTADGKPRRFSLQEFLKSNQILVLGNYQTATAPIQAINRVLFRRLSELILSQGESPGEDRRTWIFLDEVRKLGKLDGLDDVMTNGRSKGACVVLGFQDISGLRSVYGEQIADEITAMPATFGILRVAGTKTPQWASELFGEQEVIEPVNQRSSGVSSSGYQTGSSQSDQIREKKLFLPSQFRLIPSPQKGKPLYGFFFSAFVKDDDGVPYSWEAEIPSSVIDSRLDAKSKTTPDFQDWDCLPAEKKLKARSPESFKHLGISPMEIENQSQQPNKPTEQQSESEPFVKVRRQSQTR